MKQLTKDQAITFANSEVWKEWNDEKQFTESKNIVCFCYHTVRSIDVSNYTS